MMKRALLILGYMLAIGVPTGLIVQKERVIANSEPMLLPLAPVDPRSLMQGDYMILRYQLSEALIRTAEQEQWPASGILLVTLDENGVVTDGKLAQGAAPGPDQARLEYRLRGGKIRLGAESFFFQEGTAPAYAEARFGELRVDRAGEAVLVGLRGEDREILGPPEAHPLQSEN